jgi:hypothetical protein
MEQPGEPIVHRSPILRSARVTIAPNRQPLALRRPVRTGYWARKRVRRDWSADVDRLRKQAPRLLANGFGRVLLEWTDAFPPTIRAREPWVLHYHAVGLRLSSDAFATAFRMQEQARDVFESIADREGYGRALTELGVLAELLDRGDEAQTLLRQALQVIGESDRFLAKTIRDALGRVRAIALPDQQLLGRDDVIRARLEQALRENRITGDGLHLLREQYGLTPAELHIFVEYYLTDGGEQESGQPKRRALAQRLHLSENTLMHHISSIRRKLGLVARGNSASVLMWCLNAGITNLQAVKAVSR